VAGSAALNGTLQLLNLGYQPQRGDTLQLVTAGGAISGRFAKFQNPFTTSAGFNTIDLVYAPNSVTLEFLQTNSGGSVSTTEFSSFAMTPNQRAAASLLDALQQEWVQLHHGRRQSRYRLPPHRSISGRRDGRVFSYLDLAQAQWQ
jgi:hypothetical protein